MNQEFPLILAKLTQTEMLLFRRSGLTYTGATGRWGGKGVPHGPYIATYASELIPALRVMGWTHAKLKLRSDELIVRKR